MNFMNIDKDNIYKKQLNDMFGDFEALPPIDGWEAIEESMDKSNRIFIAKRNWYIGSAAALTLIIISSVYFLNLSNQINSSVETVVEITQQNDIPNSNFDQVSTVENKKPSTLAKASILARTEAAINTHDLTTVKSDITVETTDIKASQNEESDESHKKESKLSQYEINRRIKELQEANSFEFEEEIKTGIKNKQNKRLMLALNASGGLTSSQKTANSPMRLRSISSTDESMKQEAYLSAGSKNNLSTDANNLLLQNTNVGKNNSKMIHSQPYSFGISVSKNIIDRFSVETGIVYTYLYSETRNSSTGYINEENQQFHFIGIPLHFNYQFVEIGKLGLFASIGGMIEKDIHGVYKGRDEGNMNDYVGNSEGYISTNINLKNPQLSIDAGIGASYPIYKGLNIYAKIGGAYYFDAKNYEYKTIYSDKKIMLDLNAGIKFQF